MWRAPKLRNLQASRHHSSDGRKEALSQGTSRRRSSASARSCSRGLDVIQTYIDRMSQRQPAIAVHRHLGSIEHRLVALQNRARRHHGRVSSAISAGNGRCALNDGVGAGHAASPARVDHRLSGRADFVRPIRRAPRATIREQALPAHERAEGGSHSQLEPRVLVDEPQRPRRAPRRAIRDSRSQRSACREPDARAGSS